VDCNAEGFFLLAKFEPILEAIREKNPGFLVKTAELVNRFSAAAQRYEAVLKNVEARRNSMPAKAESHGQYSYPAKP
jgi:dTDP-4-dehydrorhamnose reductase